MGAKLNAAEGVWVMEFDSTASDCVVLDPRLVITLPEGLQFDFDFVFGKEPTTDADVLVGNLSIFRGKETKASDIAIDCGLRARKDEAIEYDHFKMFKPSQGVPLKEMARVVLEHDVEINSREPFKRLLLNHTVQGFFHLHTAQVKVALARPVGRADYVLIVVEFARNDQVMHKFTFTLSWEKAKSAFSLKSVLAL